MNATRYDTRRSVAEIHDEVLGDIEEGTICPCCEQLAKVYDRPLSATMIGTARRLLLRQMQQVENGEGEWVDLARDVDQPSRDFATTAYFGISERIGTREDGGKASRWRITRTGKGYLRNEFKLPKYARVYNGQLIRLWGEPRGVRDVEPTFRYDDLMEPKHAPPEGQLFDAPPPPPPRPDSPYSEGR